MATDLFYDLLKPSKSLCRVFYFVLSDISHSTFILSEIFR